MASSCSRSSRTLLKELCSSFRGTRVLSTYYDSQSGETITIPERISLHVKDPILGDSNMPSLGRSQGLWQTLAVSGACDDSVESIISQIPKLGVKNKNVCVNIIDSFDIDSNHLQMVAAMLGDTGVGRIMLMAETKEKMAAVDPDTILDACEACLGVDLQGQPMLARLGVRAAASSSDVWRDQIEAALDCNIMHFDASLVHNGEDGPLLSDLLLEIENRGRAHDGGGVLSVP